MRLLVFGVVLVLFGAFMFREIAKEDTAQHERSQAWLAFSMAHHCRIVREPSFGNPVTLWQCDGNFQVER